MAQLTVRGLDDRLVKKLKMRAAKNGRSAEAEHRAILQEVLVESGEDWWERARRLREEIRSVYGILPDSGQSRADMIDELVRRDEERAGAAKPRGD